MPGSCTCRSSVKILLLPAGSYYQQYLLAVAEDKNSSLSLDKSGLLLTSCLLCVCIFEYACVCVCLGRNNPQLSLYCFHETLVAFTIRLIWSHTSETVFVFVYLFVCLLDSLLCLMMLKQDPWDWVIWNEWKSYRCQCHRSREQLEPFMWWKVEGQEKECVSKTSNSLSPFINSIHPLGRVEPLRSKCLPVFPTSHHSCL